MPAILTVFTGGTIGCAPAGPDGVRDLPARAGGTWRDYALTARYAEAYGAGVAFETMEPLRVLSENMTVTHWNTLLAALRGVDFARYAGVVMTHGTDSLAYTAALLGVMLAHVPVPVVLVSADAPLDDPASNGHANFAGAVKFILEAGKRGVYAACRQGGRAADILPAVFLRQSRAFEDTFRCAEGGIDAAVSDTDYLSRPGELKPCVLMIEPHVGLDYARYRLEGVRAVLHGLYHSFTCCMEGEGSGSVRYLLDACRRAGADVWFAPYRTPAQPYPSTRTLQGLGARVLPVRTPELAYAKLLIAYSLFEDAGERETFLRGS